VRPTKKALCAKADHRVNGYFHDADAASNRDEGHVPCPWCREKVRVPHRYSKDGWTWLAPSRSYLVELVVRHVLDEDSECPGREER
jgi:hypothetical protein